MAAAAGRYRRRLVQAVASTVAATLAAPTSSSSSREPRPRQDGQPRRGLCVSLCDGAGAHGTHVTDWGNPARAAKLQVEYQKRDVVQQRAEIVALLKPRLGERILDVGCGPGYLVKDLCEAVGDAGIVHGLDPSAAMCSMAEERLQGVQSATVSSGSAERLPFEDCSFDAVVLSQVLLYVPDVPGALAEVRRVLRPGGRLVICDTDWNSLVVNTTDRARFAQIFGACVSTFVHPHLPPLLPGFLQNAGLSLLEVRTLPMLSAGRAGDNFMANWAFNVVPDKAKTFGLPEAVVEAWLAEQRGLDRDNAFFACVHRFLFVARRD